ncbi:MAG: DUF3488 and transglutaminase-like domain-containing protein [Wenzhouxiangellaceae bacterium]
MSRPDATAIIVPGRSSVLLLVAAYVVALLPFLPELPITLTMLIAAALIWRIMVIRTRSRPVAGWLRLLLTFGALGVVLLEYGLLWGRWAATALLCVMTAAKLTESFRLRDARIVAALCLFLVSVRFLFSQELPLLLYMLVTCGLALAAMQQLQVDEDRALAGAADTGDRSVAPSLKSAAVLILLACPFALLMFVLFPRLSTPMWGIPETALDGRTGISEQMSPGSIVSLYIDDSPAFRVEFDGPPPPPEQRYWRGPVLWRLDGQTWKRAWVSNRPAPRVPSAGPSALDYTVVQEPTEQHWLSALDYPARWPADAMLSADYELVRKDPVTAVIRYRLTSQPDFIDSPRLMAVYRQLGLELPPGSNPRTRALASQLRAQYPDDRALIDAVLDWFRTEAFYYSLQAPPLGRDMADEFLFDLRTGYCEYYASAFAILMRAAGIPTRIVTGYQGGYWHENGQYLLIRQSDAHAWNEVWLQGSGWVRVDPTAAVAPGRILNGSRDALPGSGRGVMSDWLWRMRNRLDLLQHLWNRWVLGFDAERQQQMFRRIGIDELPAWLHALLLAGAALGALLPVLYLALRARVGVEPPAVRAWHRLLERLRRRGIELPPGVTPLELSRHVHEKLGDESGFRDLCEAYNVYRYGHEDWTEAQQQALARRLNRWRMPGSKGTLASERRSKQQNRQHS